MVDIIKAIESLRPTAKWSLVGYSYENLEWSDESQTKPTEAEINAEIARLQLEHTNKEYQRQRAAEYPSIADQLDTLYHGGYDAWKEAIQQIKNKYPKT